MADDDVEVPKTFRHVAKHRICVEMLRGIRGNGTPWKALITDEMTVKVMSSACKVADITEEYISVVEDLNKRRQPLPNLDAVYFIQPTRASVTKLMEDMGGKVALYKRAFVFFSSALPREILATIKGNQVLLTRLAALREMNLEYIAMDSQAFVTDQEPALELLFGEGSDSSPTYQTAVEDIATRLSTVFASLREFPTIRYRKAKSADEGKLTARDLVPTKVASALWDRLRNFRSLPGFPQAETCDLLIIDRSSDAIAPVIHEWTYDAMCHDLLNIGNGGKYEYEVQTNAGKTESKEVLLDEHDPLWMELRDLHIAEVNKRLSDKTLEFKNANKAAQVKSGERGEEVKAKEMRDVVKNLQSGFLEQKAKLSLHVDLASNLNTKMRTDALTDIGALEQDLIFGDATSKEIISLINAKPDMKADDKVRLLMVYAATHPDKLDPTKRAQWMKLMRLEPEDMQCINNLEYLGVSVSKKATGTLKLGFGNKKSKKPARKEREDEQTYSLSRFTPLVMDLVEELAEGKLAADEYPFVKQPTGGAGGDSSSRGGVTSARASARTARTSNWAAKDESKAKPTSPSDISLQGRRIIVFVVGGMTHSEVRAAHKLTGQLKREVILGSTTLDTPSTFLKGIRKLARLETIAL